MQKRELAINKWNEQDRPREKMMHLGTEALSNAELLAILIGSGSTDESAVGLMRRVLDGCSDSLRQLGRKSVQELCAFKGVGPAKAVTILAACELGNRRLKEEQPIPQRMDNPNEVYNYFWPQMRDLAIEECWVMFLNQNLRLIDAQRISRGGLTETSVDVRIILREALLHNASALLLCHNHPSGSPLPSAADDKITERLYQSANMMNIHLIDHIVAAEDGFYSYADEGKL